ncbi:serum response factor-like isoform X2 [Apostichopus japonicus]|uniref:serum response factor-like isoform X2 n=1 Tax=Stichopus japonicus TaxID=307972 RepID=UPI003AB5998D
MSAAKYMMAHGGVENGNVETKYSQANLNVRSGAVLHSEMQLDKDVANGAESHSPTGVSPYEHNDGPPAKKQKKTKGRVKIKMEFIDNKLRRYTTFSKRKTGIMKKAYELSTLTGTQVMLLVASETGHVYTFATRKLQPMITSESGKALIQTCLNSPDLPGENQSRRSPDQRMCATGFEETELSYSVSEEDEKESPRNPTMFTVTVPGAGADVPSGSNTSSTGLSLAGTGHTYPMTTYLPTTTVSSGLRHNVSATNSIISRNSVATAQSSPTASFTTLLPQTTSLTSAGALQAGLVQVTQAQTPVQVQALPHQGAPPALVRYDHGLPQQATATMSGNTRQQLLTTLLPTVSSGQQQQLATAQPANAVAMLASTQPQALTTSNGSTYTTPHIMYQTPQGVVYAAGAAGTVNIPEALVLNYQAAAHQTQTLGAGGQATQTYPITALPLPLQGVALSQQLPQGTMLNAETAKKLTAGQGRSST